MSGGTRINTIIYIYKYVKQQMGLVGRLHRENGLFSIGHLIRRMNLCGGDAGSVHECAFHKPYGNTAFRSPLILGFGYSRESLSYSDHFLKSGGRSVYSV